jgi:hypothetical protein
MDAIRKKMQSLKTETENLYKTIKSLEDEARNSEEIASGVTRTSGTSPRGSPSWRRTLMAPMTNWLPPMLAWRRGRRL